MEPDVIFEKRKAPNDMPLYDWRELGLIRNIDEKFQKEYYKKEIYQILPVRFLFKMLAKRKIRFMNIAKHWQDPYELFMLKYDISVDGHSYKEIMSQMCMRYYGQCWSEIRDSDAMWRIYSHDMGSVRIKTTVGKMIDVINQTREMVSVVPLFGKVQYLNKKEMSSWLKTKMNEGSGQLYFAFGDSLLIKREEFVHENEVRFVLYFDEQGVSPTTDKLNCKYGNVYDEFIDLEVKPSQFIEEIAFDPRLGADDFTDWKNMLSLVSGKIPIVQSDLYAFLPDSFELKKTPMHITLFHDE